MLWFNLVANLICLVPPLNTVLCRNGDDRTSGILNPLQESSVNFTALNLHSAQCCIVLLICDSSINIFLSYLRVFFSEWELKYLYFIAVTILAATFLIWLEKSVFWDNLVVWLDSRCYIVCVPAIKRVKGYVRKGFSSAC